MITLIDVRAYKGLSSEAQADVDAFVAHVGVTLTDTVGILVDYDRHGFGVTFETLRRDSEGQAFLGEDHREVATQTVEYLQFAPGQFAHVGGRILN